MCANVLRLKWELFIEEIKVLNVQELIEEAKKFENNTKAKRTVEKAWQQHKKFLSLYPFREHPEDIDLLTPDKIVQCARTSAA